MGYKAQLVTAILLARSELGDFGGDREKIERLNRSLNRSTIEELRRILKMVRVRQLATKEARDGR